VRTLAALALSALLVAPRQAVAQAPVRPQPLDAARTLALDGMAALDAGAYGPALSACEEARRIVDTPPILLCQARALVGLHRLDEGLATYRMLLVRLPAENAPPAWLAAKRDAAIEHRATALALLDHHQKVMESRLGVSDYRGALDAADRAATIEPSLATSLGRARALVGLDRPEEALREYGQVLVSGGETLPEAQRRAVLAEIEETKRRMLPARLVLRVTAVPGLHLVLDDDPPAKLVENQFLDLPRGAHLLRVAAPGHLPMVRRLELAGGEQRVVDVALHEAPPLRTAGWWTLGVGAAALGTSAVLAAQTVAQNDVLLQACTTDLACGISQREAIASLHALRVGTFVTGGLGLAALAASTTLHLLAPSDHMPRAPSVTVGLDGLTVSGAF